MLSGLITWFKPLFMEVKLYMFYRPILAHMGMLPCYMAMGSAGLGEDTQYTLYFKNCGCMATEKMNVLEQP